MLYDIDLCCDVRNMKSEIDDESMDVVIDKGTLDSVLVSVGVFSVDHIQIKIAQKCSERS